MSAQSAAPRPGTTWTAFHGEDHEGVANTLPAGERVLWQGAPCWRVLARQVFHVRGLTLYFGLLLLFCVVSGALNGTAAGALALNTAKLAALSAVPLAVVLLYAWGVGRSTTYTVTSKRVVLRMGLVLPITLNLPFAQVEAAGLHEGQDGVGDICLSLTRDQRLGYFLLWPHARPWRLARPEPMLRAIPDAAHAGRILARALAAASDMPAPVMAPNERPGVGTTEPVTA